MSYSIAKMARASKPDVPPVHILALSVFLICGISCHHDDPSMFDAGVVFGDQTPSIRHTFRFRNRTNHVIRITKVLKSCTCTAVNVHPMSIAPGGLANINMVVETSKAAGHWNVFSTLETDDPEFHERTFYLTYNTYPHVNFSDQSVIMPTISADDSSAHPTVHHVSTFLDFYNRPSDRPDGPQQFRLDAPIQVAVNDTPLIDYPERGTIRRTRYQITLTHAPNKDLAGVSGARSAVLTCISHLGHQTATVITWKLVSPVAVSPDPVFFDLSSTVKWPVDKTLLIRAQDNIPFRLLSLGRVSHPAIVEADVAEKSSMSCTQLVHLKLGRAPGAKRFASGTLELFTDHDKAHRILVPWSLMYSN